VAPERLLSDKLKQEWVTMAQNKFDLDDKEIRKLNQNSKSRSDFLLALYGVVINSKN
jgi:hypothetical protein